MALWKEIQNDDFLTIYIVDSSRFVFCIGQMNFILQIVKVIAAFGTGLRRRNSQICFESTTLGLFFCSNRLITYFDMMTYEGGHILKNKFKEEFLIEQFRIVEIYSFPHQPLYFLVFWLAINQFQVPIWNLE